MYAASFLFESCWPCAFFSFIPLFSQSFPSYYKAAFAGFLWGVIAYGSTLSALLEVIVRLGQKPLSYLYALGFLGYFVFFSMMWCIAVLFFKRCTKQGAWGWFVGTILYFSWMQHGFFYFLVRRWYGYGLACPLLPLIKVPVFLGLLPKVTYVGLLGGLFLFQAGIAQRNLQWVFVGALPFFLGLFCFPGNKGQEKLPEKVVMLAQSFHQTTPYERAQEVGEVLRNAEGAFPAAVVFILPESTFPFPLNKYAYVYEMWSKAASKKYVIVGSHFVEQEEEGKERLYNSVYVLYNGQVLYRYDKKKLLPFFEEHWLGCVRNSPFLENKCAFVPASSFQQGGCFIPPLGNCAFCVCSELLWDMPLKKQVIAVVHDGYYRFTYFSGLFKAFAYFQALEKQSDLFYCGWKEKGHLSETVAGEQTAKASFIFRDLVKNKK